MSNTSAKINTREQLVEIVKGLQSQKKIIGFTSGAFDLLHAGHVDYLEKAHQQCDVLIVAVNSDTSIKSYKDANRPVRPEAERLRLVAALDCVEHVFLFTEVNNNKNIEILKPNIYFKAGDYSKEKLSSAPLVESYGGEVKIIPFLPGYSSTSIIEDICFRFATVNAAPIEVEKSKEKQKAVLLDRDGTINEFVDYLHDPAQFKLIPGVIEALQNFQKGGYLIAIVTNQPGIGIGHFRKEDYFAVTKEFFKLVSKAGINIDKVYFCPHSQAENCTCRKPSTGMVDRAIKELNLDINKSFIIGDTTIDIMLAKNAGCRSILVKTGLAGKDGNYEAIPDFIARDLKEASEMVLKGC